MNAQNYHECWEVDKWILAEEYFLTHRLMCVKNKHDYSEQSLMNVKAMIKA